MDEIERLHFEIADLRTAMDRMKDAIAKQADEWDKLRKRINEADDAKRRYFADNRTPEFGTAPNGG